MIDLGDSYRLGVEIQDSTGAFVDADPLTLTVTLPDQSTVSLTPIVHEDTGKYHFSYLTSQPGRHVARWVGTVGSDQFAHTDVFDVDSTDISIVPLSEVKTQLGITNTTNDDELRGYLLSASENIEDTAGICAVRSFTSRVGRQLAWTNSLWLPQRPVVSVTSLTPVYQWSSAVDTSEITTRLTNGKITRLDGWAFWGEYDIEYVAGRPVIPWQLRTACKMIVQHLWQTRRGPGNVPSGGMDVVTLPGWGYAIPQRAAELIQGNAVEMLIA